MIVHILCTWYWYKTILWTEINFFFKFNFQFEIEKWKLNFRRLPFITKLKFSFARLHSHKKNNVHPTSGICLIRPIYFARISKTLEWQTNITSLYARKLNNNKYRYVTKESIIKSAFQVGLS